MSTKDAGNLRSICVINFSRKHSDWRKWSFKFLSYAGLKGHDDILLGNVIAPDNDEVIDETTDQGKAKMELRKKNKEAFTALALSIDDDTSIRAVEVKITDKYKTGSAKQAWDNLLEIYQPKTMANKVQLLHEFTNNRLKDANMNPDAWLDELENLWKRLKNAGITKTDEELIMHVLNNLPMEYDTVVEILEMTQM